MLIIFDLDDTLVDTSGSILPHLQENALKKMCEMGLKLPSFEKAIATLKRLDETAISSKKALSEFIEIHDGNELMYEAAMKEIYHPPQITEPVFPVDDAIKLLKQLQIDHQLALVTVGQEATQKFKMNQVGINPRWFREIFVLNERNKKPYYEKILKKFRIAPNKSLVCGDRISYDLAPAKELGCHTVQLKWGRGLGNTGFKRDVDYTILHLGQLWRIIKEVSLR